MNIDSDKTKALYQLSLDKTYAKASISLGISQPALSKKIMRLEEELETTLVIRDTKGVLFTEAGQEVLRYYQFKRDLDFELLQKLSHQNSKKFIGEISIASYSSIGRSVLIPCLSGLIGKYPDAKINLSVKEMRELFQSLTSGESGFVLSDTKLNRINIVSTEIAKEEHVHITGKDAKFTDFFLDHDPEDQTTINFFKTQEKPSKDIKRNYFDDIYSIIDAVALGYGQAIVSKHLVKHNPEIQIITHNKKFFTPVYLNYFNRPYFPEIHKEVIALLINKFKSFL